MGKYEAQSLFPPVGINHKIADTSAEQRCILVHIQGAEGIIHR